MDYRFAEFSEWADIKDRVGIRTIPIKVGWRTTRDIGFGS